MRRRPRSAHQQRPPHTAHGKTTHRQHIFHQIQHAATHVYILSMAPSTAVRPRKRQGREGPPEAAQHHRGRRATKHKQHGPRAGQWQNDNGRGTEAKQSSPETRTNAPCTSPKARAEVALVYRSPAKALSTGIHSKALQRTTTPRPPKPISPPQAPITEWGDPPTKPQRAYHDTPTA